MKLFSTNKQAVDAATQLLSTYSNLHRLMERGDLSSFWLDYLERKSIDVNELLGRVLTVFTVSIILSFVGKRGITNPFIAPYEGMLSSLDRAIGTLECSQNLECFRSKLRNPEGTQTISCFSELFLAEHFRKKGFTVSFESPFQIEFKDGNVVKRDFDVTITLNGQSFFVEVYTPVSPIRAGELGIPGESYSDFLTRIKHKAADKFGFGSQSSIKAPSFPKVLAVNARYYDSVSFELVLGLETKRLIRDLRSMFSETFPLDAIIIFQINDTNPSMPLVFHHIEFNERTTTLGNGT